MLTLRITVVRDGKGTYVLGNGSALGVEVPPRPTCVESRAGVDEVVVRDGADAQAEAPARRRQRNARM
jgi:hypothetical protein